MGEDADHPLEGTKLRIAEAALETLRTKGFNGASAREIAVQGAFNQALIFYHFGSVEKLLLAALELVSRRRMHAYREPFEQAAALPDLAALGRRIYEEDLANGYVVVLGELVTAGASRPQLGAGVAACLQPWFDMVERKVTALIGGSGPGSAHPASRCGVRDHRALPGRRHAQPPRGKRSARAIGVRSRRAPCHCGRRVAPLPARRQRWLTTPTWIS